MSGGKLPTPAPVVNPETAPFWQATAQHRLLLPLCRACGATYWYPRSICPRCHSLDTSWIEAAGRGSIYSFTVVRRGDGPFASASPYVLAYVELAEGPRMLTNIIEWESGLLAIGAPVEIVFQDTDAGSSLPRFRLLR